MAGKALWGQGIFCVILTPPLIGGIQIFGAGFIICLERHIALRGEEVQNVVGIPDSGRNIVLGSLADGEVIVISDQPPQSLQHPEEAPLFFCDQLFRKKGIVKPLHRFVLGGQNDLAAKESVAAVMECGQCPIAETEETDIDQPLIALLFLTFQVHSQFCGHDGFDIVGLVQSVHIQIIVNHQQLAL